MVASCLTHHLKRTGKNATMFKKLVTLETTKRFKNYTSSSLFSAQAALHQCQRILYQRFHSNSSWNQRLTPQEFAVCESGRGGPAIDLGNLGIWGTAEGKGALLNSILKLQGTSLDQIQAITEQANGNVESAVAGINKEVGKSILKVDGENVRVNVKQLKKLLKESLTGGFFNKLPQKTPVVQNVENAIDDEIDKNVDAAAVTGVISIEEALNAKSLQKRDAGTDIISTLLNTITGLLSNSVGGLISTLLEPVKSLLQGFITSSSTGNSILDAIYGTLNVVITSLIDVITSIETALGGLSTGARRRRDTGSESSGLLEPIISPILNLLGSFLAPVNALLKGIIAPLGTLLQSIVGSTLASSVTAVATAVIDALIPCGNSCTA